MEVQTGATTVFQNPYIRTCPYVRFLCIDFKLNAYKCVLVSSLSHMKESKMVKWLIDQLAFYKTGHIYFHIHIFRSYFVGEEIFTHLSVWQEWTHVSSDVLDTCPRYHNSFWTSKQQCFDTQFETNIEWSSMHICDGNLSLISFHYFNYIHASSIYVLLIIYFTRIRCGHTHTVHKTLTFYHHLFPIVHNPEFLYAIYFNHSREVHRHYMIFVLKLLSRYSITPKLYNFSIKTFSQKRPEFNLTP